MVVAAIWRRIRRSLRHLRRARGGNVTLTFAAASVPLLGPAGAALDYSRANSARTSMQAATDSTALMLSKHAQTLTEQQLNTKATAYFNALFVRPETTNIVVTPNFTTPQNGSFKLTVSASAKIPTTLMKIFNKDSVDLSAYAEVLWGMKKLEVALALDNTGSMGPEPKAVQSEDGCTQPPHDVAEGSQDPRRRKGCNRSVVCTNVKAAGIKLYTVRVIDGDATLLKGCATNPTMYYDVQQASQLSGVFSAIGQNLANLRISKQHIVANRRTTRRPASRPERFFTGERR